MILRITSSWTLYVGIISPCDPLMAGQPTPLPNVLPPPRNSGLIAGRFKGNQQLTRTCCNKALFLGWGYMARGYG